MRLSKIKIRDYALKLAGGLSETKASCPLPISALSIVPDFIVLLASWSGAEATPTHALNTYSTHPASVFSSDLLNLRLPGKSRFISSYSTFTRLLNLSSASAQMIPTTMQITLTIAEPAVIKLFTGMIMTVAAITMPTMPWKAME